MAPPEPHARQPIGFEPEFEDYARQSKQLVSGLDFSELQVSRIHSCQELFFRNTSKVVEGWMRRTEQLQGLRLMKFEEVYGRSYRGELSQVMSRRTGGSSRRRGAGRTDASGRAGRWWA